MSAYLVHWNGRGPATAKVLRFADKASSDAYMEGVLPGDYSAFTICSPDDFSSQVFSTNTFVSLYNAWAEKPVAKFESRNRARERVFGALEARFKSEPFTEHTMSETVNTESPKTSRKRKASEPAVTSEPKVRKTRTRSTNLGTFKPIRRDSSLGMIVTSLLEGPQTVDQLAASLMARSPERAAEWKVDASSKVRHRLQHVLRVSHGIGHTIDVSGNVSLVIPEGLSADDLFAVPKKSTEAPTETETV